MSKSVRKTVALYGGAFDPIHTGHVLAISFLLNSAPVDEVWVLISGDRPDKHCHAPAKSRLKMAQQVLRTHFGEEPRVRVEACEALGEVPALGTVATLDYLRAKNPDTTFLFTIGTELLADLPRWIAADRLRSEVSFLVLQRPGVPTVDIERARSLGYSIIVLPTKEAPLASISSTLIRERIAKKASIAGLVPRSVATFIKVHGLYGSTREEIETLYHGHFLDLCDRGTYEFARRQRSLGGVLVYATTTRQEVILVEQHRPILNRISIELPGGLLDEPGGDESVEKTGIRELEEETGYRGKEIHSLGQTTTAHGIVDEMLWFAYAKDCEKVSSGGGVGHEKITTHLVTSENLIKWCREQEARGCVIDYRIFAAQLLAKG